MNHLPFHGSWCCLISRFSLWVHTWESEEWDEYPERKSKGGKKILLSLNFPPVRCICITRTPRGYIAFDGRWKKMKVRVQTLTKFSFYFLWFRKNFQIWFLTSVICNYINLYSDNAEVTLLSSSYIGQKDPRGERNVRLVVLSIW